MKISTKVEGCKVVVDVIVRHIFGTRRKKTEYRTSDVLVKLREMGYDVESLELVKECRVFNYQTPERCHGQWVFLDTIRQAARTKLLETMKASPEPKKKRKPRKKVKTNESTS